MGVPDVISSPEYVVDKEFINQTIPLILTINNMVNNNNNSIQRVQGFRNIVSGPSLSLRSVQVAHTLQQVEISYLV